MRLHRSTPERQGVSSEKLLDFFREAAELNHEFHSFMLVKNGYVISEGWWKPYEPWLPHQMYSLSKSFTSTAVGFAVSEGLLSVDDAVVKFFPDEIKALNRQSDEKLARMTVKHLLTMSTGQATEPWPEDLNAGYVNAFLRAPVEYEPGSVFMYNSIATFMLSAIIQKLTGRTLTDYLTPRLYKPLGMTTPYWDKSAEGIDFGGVGLNLLTEDIAKLGLLYLQKGVWRDKRLLPEAWINDATDKQIDTDREIVDWSQGYGYQFWRCTHGAYRGDGAFGQFCVVMPDANAVVAITSNADLQRTMDMIWKHLHPALIAPDPALAERFTVFDSDAHMHLLAVQETLSLMGDAAEHTRPAPHQAEVLFKHHPRYDFDIRMDGLPPDETIRRLSLAYNPHRREMVLGLWVGSLAQPYLFAYKNGRWVDAVSPFPYGDRKAYAKIMLQWDDHQLTFVNRYIQTPFTLTLRLKLTGSGAKTAASGELDIFRFLERKIVPFEGSVCSIS